MADEEHILQAQRELHDAIADVMTRHGWMVTKWLAAVEIIDDSGERALESFASPDFRAWDAIGMVGFLDARERGGLAVEMLNEPGGE